MLVVAIAMISYAHAQKVTAPEPEFINSYCVLTSDSTFAVLPKESGKVEKHQSKFSKFSKIAGAVSDLQCIWFDYWCESDGYGCRCRRCR